MADQVPVFRYAWLLETSGTADEFTQEEGLVLPLRIAFGGR